MHTEIKYRIDVLKGGFISCIAFFIDCLQFFSILTLALGAVPVAGILITPIGIAFAVLVWIVSLLSWALFCLIFYLFNVPFLSFGEAGDTFSERVLRVAGALFTVVIESLPVANGMFFFTIVIITTVLDSRKQDRLSQSGSVSGE